MDGRNHLQPRTQLPDAKAVGSNNQAVRPLPQPYSTSSWSSSSTRSFPSYTSSLPSPAQHGIQAPSAFASSTPNPFRSVHPQDPSRQNNMSSFASKVPVPSPSGTNTSHPSSYNGPAQSASQQQSHLSQRSMQPLGSGHTGPLAADTFLQSSNLLAEAAKRAQMAVMERDFGDMGF